MKTVLCGLLLMMLSTGAHAQAPVNDAAAIQILDHMSAVIGELGSCSFTLTVSRDVNDADLGLVTRHSVDDVCMVGPDKMLIKIRGTPGTGNALLPGYPNPFNPSVSIPFTLREDGDVTLSIYDVGGRLVKTVLSERRQRGVHMATWDGRSQSGVHVASGVCAFASS